MKHFNALKQLSEIVFHFTENNQQQRFNSSNNLDVELPPPFALKLYRQRARLNVQFAAAICFHFLPLLHLGFLRRIQATIFANVRTLREA